MDVTWRGVALVDAHSAALTPAGAALLENELADERLAVITLLGAPTSQQRRAELVAHWLDVVAPPRSSESAVTLLACVAYIEDDYRILILDATATSDSPAYQLVGALCALSSLVVTCVDTAHDRSISTSSWFRSDTSNAAVPASALPLSFLALLDALLREHTVADVYDLTPNLLTLDCSFEPTAALQPVGSSSVPIPVGSNSGDSDNACARIITLRQRSFATIATIAALKPLAPVKSVWGVELLGARLLQLLQSCLCDMQQGNAPDLSNAFDELVERQCAAAAADALATYCDCVGAAARELPPIDRSAFEQLDCELARLALDVFHSGTRGLAAAATASQRRTARNALKQSLRESFDRELQVLTGSSHTYCTSVKTALWHDLMQRSPCGNTDTQPTVAAVLDTVEQFDDMYSAKASGPAKDAVLRAFYRDDALVAIRQLETRVTQQLTEVHLEELRTQLETAFAAKRDALVAHFQREETNLRTCMTRELETMQKLHAMRSSRVNIDATATKQVREQLAIATQRTVELERSNATLTQLLADSDTQRRALEQHVSELQRSVQLEMASRSELVDTLAATIRSAEVKESALTAEVSELRHELGEKTFRVERELTDLALQLRKTSEEKDELHKRLNDFFLRVTALPAALQQQLFCFDPDASDVAAGERVRFADALSGFMSE